MEAESFSADGGEIFRIADRYEKQARFLRPLVEDAIKNDCFTKQKSIEIMDEGSGLGLHLVANDYFREAESFAAEKIKRRKIEKGTKDYSQI